MKDYERYSVTEDPLDPKTHVLVNISITDGNQVIGWKKYVSRELWNGPLVDRRAIVAEVTDKLITAMEEDK